MQSAESNSSTVEAYAARLRNFESEAWTELWDTHHQQIWRYVYARSGSRDIADEVVAQVFAEAVTSIRRYRTTSKPILAWLYIIARNHTAKALRAARREVATPVEAVAKGLEEHLDSMVLREALDKLPGPQREVLVLRFFAGYSTDEIARALGKTPGAIYSLQARAVESMRRVLEIRKFPHTSDEFHPSAGIDTVK